MARRPGSGERQGVRLALEGEDVLFPELEREQEKMAAQVAADPKAFLGDFALSDADRAELARPERMQVIGESVAEQVAGGVSGWVDDDLAVLQPWNFAVDEIAVPVLVRYGLTDVLVTAARGKWLAANVPGCIVKVDEGAGHLGVDPETEIAESFRWLRDGIPAAGSS